MALPRGAVCWYAVCNRSISWSYKLFFYMPKCRQEHSHVICKQELDAYARLNLSWSLMYKVPKWHMVTHLLLSSYNRVYCTAIAITQLGFKLVGIPLLYNETRLFVGIL